MTAKLKRMNLKDRIHIIKRAVITACKPELVEYLTVYKTQDADYKTSHIAPKGSDGPAIIFGFIANAATKYAPTLKDLSSKLRGLNIIIVEDWAERTGFTEEVLYPIDTVVLKTDVPLSSIIHPEQPEGTPE